MNPFVVSTANTADNLTLNTTWFRVYQSHMDDFGVIIWQGYISSNPPQPTWCIPLRDGTNTKSSSTQPAPAKATHPSKNSHYSYTNKQQSHPPLRPRQSFPPTYTEGATRIQTLERRQKTTTANEPFTGAQPRNITTAHIQLQMAAWQSAAEQTETKPTRQTGTDDGTETNKTDIFQHVCVYLCVHECIKVRNSWCVYSVNAQESF